MKLKDFQFATTVTSGGTHIDVEVTQNGADDSVSFDGEKMKVHRPSSITKTIFNMAYRLLEKQCSDAIERDALSIALYQAAADYVYWDGEDVAVPAVYLIKGDRTTIPNLLLRELVQPIIDTEIDTRPLLFVPCDFTDACRTVTSYEDLTKHGDYGVQREKIAFHMYPLIVCNSTIRNRAAIDAHAFYLQLCEAAGEERAKSIVSRILLDREESILPSVLMRLMTLETEGYTSEFLRFLQSHAKLGEIEIVETTVIIVSQSEKHLGTKLAQMMDPMRPPQISNQWAQWATLGLIEKQLNPARITRHELTENMKPVDRERSKLIAIKARRAGKKTLNMEELLEVGRDLYDTHAIEPGRLGETLLAKDRVW